MYRISEIAVAIAKADNLDDDQVPVLDKALRNLTQRTGISPAGRAGRADLYADDGACVVRLAERVAALGIARHVTDSFVRFLQSVGDGPKRYRSLNGVRRALTVIEEAIDRAREGEDFALGFVVVDGRPIPREWFPREEADDAAKRILDSYALVSPPRRVDVEVRIDAGRLIREFFAQLEG